MRAIANLFDMPVMHACRETESAQAAVRSRCEGYCACCGAWPAYSEICGVARERRLCCGRCGTSWTHEVLSCTYCGTHDHKVLSTLDVESDQLRGGIEVCERCRGYLRQFCSLTHSGPMDVLVRDLGSVELDVAATNRSYVRPRGVGRTGTVLPRLRHYRCTMGPLPRWTRGCGLRSYAHGSSKRCAVRRDAGFREKEIRCRTLSGFWQNVPCWKLSYVMIRNPKHPKHGSSRTWRALLQGGPTAQVGQWFKLYSRSGGWRSA